MTLTRDQWETLESAIGRIIPEDTDAGGWQAGVGDYLARQFESGGLQDRVDAYRIGLDALNQEAQTFARKAFRDLSPEQQDQLLTSVEAGRVKAPWNIDPERFFRMLVDNAMEGFYADPGNGGNHEETSWRMIGFEVRG